MADVVKTSHEELRDIAQEEQRFAARCENWLLWFIAMILVLALMGIPTILHWTILLRNKNYTAFYINGGALIGGLICGTGLLITHAKHKKIFRKLDLLCQCNTKIP